jgi:hypothetical protein
MSIPLPTTTISILRPDPTADTYDTDNGPTVVLSGIRANIGSQRGSGNETGGQLALLSLRMQCDVVDLRHTDYVRDDSDGVVYSVVWVKTRMGLGVDHIEAGLQLAEGAS